MTKTMNRRMFLRGAGGAIMAIPFLPSLTSRTFAADPKPGPPGKCFFAVSTDHGEVWGKNMYPGEDLLTQKLNYAGRDVRYGNLPSAPDANGNVVFSPMCTASAQLMTPGLAQKFNILRGVDMPYRFGHNTGHLGNFAATTGNVVAGISAISYAAPSIDQVMAYSPSFYTQDALNAQMTQRSFCVLSGRLSYNFTSPDVQKGNLITQLAHRDNQELFDYLFKPATAFHGVDTAIIDRVKQSYDLLKKDPRLSKGDLLRLNQHVEQMFEVERKLKVSALIQVPDIPNHVCGLEGPGSLGADCQGKTSKHWNHHGGDTMRLSANMNADYCDLMADIIALSFSAGVSRVATWHQAELKFADTLIGDWHGQVAHSGFGGSVAQNWALGYNQGTFEHILVRLAAKLDAIQMGDGSTLLDNSLLMQTSESGQITHHTGCVHYPVVTAGGAGGYFKTGMFVDFSDKTQVYTDFDKILAQKPGLIPESPGLYYNQFLANALMSMGVPSEEWENFTEFTADGPQKSTPTKGYGFHYVDAHRAADYEKAKLVMGDKLPVIT